MKQTNKPKNANEFFVFPHMIGYENTKRTLYVFWIFGSWEIFWWGVMGNTRRPMILYTTLALRKGKGKGGGNAPSVILLHAKYNTPTDAVSSIVATNDPSTFAFDPYTYDQ
jgi:hypothetical protein